MPYSGVIDGEEYFATGVYSHRPLFKKQVREFTSLVQSSLTFYAFDLLKGSKTLSP